MSLIVKRAVASDFDIPFRTSVGAGRVVSRKQALRHSALWACQRLRADLISTLPIDVFTTSGGIPVEVPAPPVIRNPGGEKIDATEWMYDTQQDLDGTGNTFGVITATDGFGLPREIQLVPVEDVTVRVRKGVVSYLVAGREEPNVWHEKQFTSSGLAVGLSPIAHAAMYLSQASSAQVFAIDWFSGGAVPSGRLKYSESTVPAKEAEAIKARYRLAIENGDVFVHGKDWDYQVTSGQGAQESFLDAIKATDTDITRFMGVPGDLIDAAPQGSSVTYANITQRNLQLLVMNLGPAIIRREKALSRLLPSPRYVKLNTAALLRMDPETVAKSLGQQVREFLLAPSEARAINDREPFTDEQVAEFKALGLIKDPVATSANRGATE